MPYRPMLTLNKFVVLILAGAFLGLTIDLRYEHVDKVRRYWEAWIPIIYSGVMAIVCLICLFLWERHGRGVLFYTFALSLVVGIAGNRCSNHLRWVTLPWP